ncbi:MAG: CPBP family intramembrane metalloprotease [Clostridia bacterium]|nr:CPBP family intramembrane metalloprotease [Clostridia bacterium]
MHQTGTAKKKSRTVFYLSMAFLSGILIYFVQYFVCGWILNCVFSLFGKEWARIEWLNILVQALLYLLSMGVSAALLLLVFKKSPLSGFSGPLACPRWPFLFIPVTIGSLYLLNIVVNTVFEHWLEPFNTPITAESFPHSPIGVAVYLIYLSVLPAIFEEWLFRGVLQKNLATVISRRSAIVVSAFIFGFMHVDPGQTVFAIGFGLFAGYVFDQTGSIWFGVLIHMVNNAISGCVSYWTYVYESEEATTFFGIYMLAVIAIAIFGGVAYIATAGKQKRIRAGEAERMLPKGKAVLVASLKSPMLYIMLVSYGLLLWVGYFA